MGWFFQKKKEFDFGGELDRLEMKLEEAQYNIDNIQSQKKKILFRYTVCSLAIYTIGMAVWASRSSILFQHPLFSKLFRISLYILGVFSLYMFRWAIAWFCEKRLSRARMNLHKLNAEKRKILDALKSRKEYFETQALLEKYGEQPTLAQKKLSNAAAAKSVPGSSSSSSDPMHPQHWYDRVLEGLVGANENSENNREALICSHCFHHNGLASYGEKASDVRYVCLFCKAWNGPPIDKSLPSSEMDSNLQTNPSSISKGKKNNSNNTTQKGPNIISSPQVINASSPVRKAGKKKSKKALPTSPLSSSSPDASYNSVSDSFHTVAASVPESLTPTK
ncbi:lunapark Lnp1 [Schizosaccharomyces pombe]|uniref:Endoplasmic reticulum junction formation protein lunapark n=1 Tax=Schizosaccharomyces pombe (strain 972 / ATCC 24843) TaxID=284812 RepID=LNP_SCHPO|nr:protein lunapark [Schizosaccharomyces pombe]O94414.1 RecName: Full=Endoplasmic reticulum junction formation protein lunapark; AltName: Full=ER junction formation factor lunapark [Schizosaccharomyces pombe 972h-]CAA22491.1 lunapark homolog [Schizosaccharomyces pombe]|eukprot:NP_588465.1 protein lunapark [Schizosaccharomyces pombe]